MSKNPPKTQTISNEFKIPQDTKNIPHSQLPKVEPLNRQPSQHHVFPESCLRPDRGSSRSPSPRSPSPSGPYSWSPKSRRSTSPASRRGSACSGYEQYQRSLLEVPMILDYGDASSDDLSSEWDSDVPEFPKVRFEVSSYFV